MKEKLKNKKVLVMLIGILVLVALVFGGTYAYYTVGTTNSFGSKTISATTPETGSVALRANNNISMILTNEQMIDKGVDTTYYGVSGSEGIASETETTVPIGEVTVVGNESFDCDYTFTVTKTPASGSMYEAFQSMNSKSAGQIVLTITPFGGTPTVLDFNTANLFTNQVISGTVRGITKDTTNLINAQLKLVNKTGMDQGALAGTNITISIVPTTFTCESHDDSVPVFEPPQIGNFVTLDNQEGIYYRVLYNDSGTNYMLLRMNDTDVVFFDETRNPGSNVYAGSTLDTYLNETYYNTLSENIKNAIVEKSIVQKSYPYTDDIIAKSDSSHTYIYENNFGGINNYRKLDLESTTEPFNRKVYAPSIEDVYKYMSALKGSTQKEITSEELLNMFINTKGEETGVSCIWLRDAAANNIYHIWEVALGTGTFGTVYHEEDFILSRPEFVIDLSKVDFTEVDPTTIESSQLGY